MLLSSNTNTDNQLRHHYKSFRQEKIIVKARMSSLFPDIDGGAQSFMSSVVDSLFEEASSCSDP